MRPDVAELWKRCEGQTVGGTLLLVRCLHGGEDSAVFLTENDGQQAALKLVKANPRTADLQLSRWGMTSKLSHPHLLRISGSGRWQFEGVPLLYVVMEYAEEDLSQVLPHRPLSAAEAGDVLEPVLGALQYLHREGLVHGHLKPSNVMAVNDQLKISSDGLCRIRESQEVSARAGAYDPPEIDTAGVSPAGDIWSLGVVLVEILTQRLPVWAQAEQQEPALPDTVPDPFGEIARHCLQKNPRSRWTPEQITQALHPTAVVNAAPRRVSLKLRYVLPAVALVLAALGIVLTRGMQSKASSIVPPPAVPAEAPKTEPVIPSPKPPARPTPAAKHAGPADVVHEVMPDVPRKARNSIHGKVTVSLKLTVDPTGAVQDATVDPPESSKFFANLALKAARQWRFRPDSGQNWILRFDFTRTGTKAFPARQ